MAEKYRKPRDREVEDGFDVFRPTAAGIRKWVKETEPTPARRDVLAHINELRRDKQLPEGEVAKLTSDYPELAA